MSSERKLRSARANGARSRGPKTPEGKLRSSINSLTHGLTARNIVLAVEDEAKFDQIRASYLRELQPNGQLETDLVDRIVAARWHLERAGAMESALLDLEILKGEQQIEKEFEEIDPETRLAIAFRSLCDQTSALATLHRYETRHRRAFDRALKTLRDNRANPLPPSPITNHPQNLPSEPSPTNEHPASHDTSPQAAPTDPVRHRPEQQPGSLLDVQIVRRHRAQAPHPAQQRAVRRRPASGRGLRPHLSAWRRAGAKLAGATWLAAGVIFGAIRIELKKGSAWCGTFF